MKKLSQAFNWIVSARLLDGYIGILKVVLFYKILARYSVALYIFSLSLRIGRASIFSVDLEYNYFNNKKTDASFYPPFTFTLKVWKWSLFDNTREPARLTSESVNKYMEERKAQKAENERLIRAAIDAEL
jgi:hypothetical protein